MAHPDWTPESVPTWSDDKLQATLWRIGAGTIFASSAKELTAPILAEMERRELKPNHAAFATKCHLCDRTPLYRIGSYAFCRQHRGEAMTVRKAADVMYINRLNKGGELADDIERRRKRVDDFRRFRGAVPRR